ncbi:MAG: NADH-quinone oxidoreductase subunit NuoN [Cyanobacteria bacterium]|nr:NADH-quinone oxidoreductase subunit NuoN [Cyanobacteriota bacterium]
MSFLESLQSVFSGFNSLLFSSGAGRFIFDQNISRLGPEILIIIGLIFCIFTSLNKSERERQETWFIAVCVLTLSLLILGSEYSMYFMDGFSWSSRSSVLFGALQEDFFALTIRTLLVLGTLMVMLFSRRFVDTKTQVPGEFYILILGALLGAMFMVAASDLIMLFVGLETLGISSYIMAGYLRGDAKSIEASLKYLVYGGVSTAVILFGFSLLYGFTKSTNYFEMTQAIQVLNNTIDITPTIPVMCVLILGGFAFKLSAAPFHMWAPDVYEGSPTPVTAFLSVVSKIAGFAAAVRLIFGVLIGFEDVWFYLFTVLAVVSMVIGNVVALTQKNIKRLLAYSTIAHAGYMLLGLVTMTYLGVSSVFYYLLTYLFMNLGAFATVVHFGNLTGSDEISAYGGLIHKKPILTLAFSFFLLSLAGMPVTAGFFAKFFLFQSLTHDSSENIWLVVVALITSTISLFYYLNIIRLMVIAEPSPEVKRLINNEIPQYSTKSLSDVFSSLYPGLAITFCLIATLALGIFANPFLNLSQQAVVQLQTLYNSPSTAELPVPPAQKVLISQHH